MVFSLIFFLFWQEWCFMLYRFFLRISDFIHKGTKIFVINDVWT